MEALAKAISLIESTRYQVGTREFLNTFILHWASVLNQKASGSPFENDQVNKTAVELSFNLGQLMMAGHKDVLGQLLSHFGDTSFGYFPTPNGVSELMSKLHFGEKPNANISKNIYDCCSGTGSLTISTIQEIIETNTTDSNPIGDCCFHLEEISPIKCHASFIQVMFYIGYYSKVLGKPLVPGELTIMCVDVLTRKSPQLMYRLKASNTFSTTG
jgi:hypothetical protein